MTAKHDDGPDGQRWWMSRRAFLSSGAVGAAAMALGTAAGADARQATSDVDAMVLQVADATANFPVTLKVSEGVSSSERLTASRVTAAWRSVDASQTARARRSAQLLIDGRLGGAKRTQVLATLGKLAAEGSDQVIADLRALVAVAGATVTDRFADDRERAARIWLTSLAKLHSKGALASAVKAS